MNETEGDAGIGGSVEREVALVGSRVPRAYARKARWWMQIFYSATQSRALHKDEYCLQQLWVSSTC